MTIEQVKIACIKYDNVLLSTGVTEVYRNGEKGGSLTHLRWVCQEIPKMLEDNKIEKAMRWLGFLQGALWALQIIDLETLKDDNR